ncbi:hypothetical protein E0I61_15475 [Flavobacterium ranwuense]|uniref:Lipoprotein n=2 Tax=Flavobacteriaceae TaxID=49546 RepID=A0ABY2DMT5_9FLAO|nr:hypothetical protein E0I61_15475 [Flavobacterium ranwuense]TDE51159.1 hypothetical protein E0H99_12795 [Flavobacterium sp. GT3P67]
MKLRAIHRILSILILILFSSSCASDLDYNQVNDIKLEPVFISNLAYFNIPANEFVTGGIEHTVFMDTPAVDVFNDKFFKDNLSRVDLFFEVNNTINRSYRIDLVFLDRNNQPVHSTNFIVPAYTGAENIVTKTEIFQNATLDLLKRTTKITFTLTMFAGPPLSENSIGSLKLRSGVTAYFIIE